jgi:predicted RNA binding protein YcfA (HicA-like mRNA interferase family)
LPSLPLLSGAEVCGILGRYGFEKVCQRGSHLVMQKKLVSSAVTVPVPEHRELKKGTLRSIIRQSGLDVEIFCKR